MVVQDKAQDDPKTNRTEVREDLYRTHRLDLVRFTSRKMHHFTAGKRIKLHLAAYEYNLSRA